MVCRYQLHSDPNLPSVITHVVQSFADVRRHCFTAVGGAFENNAGGKRARFAAPGICLRFEFIIVVMEAGRVRSSAAKALFYYCFEEPAVCGRDTYLQA
ncbi:hypothetical protein EVAR_103453_1 [Eumeta japonica]|uniref:Uncharacterized protein n=1 Tax=Eumeta variegata TaxID=151549 RepID=A0A4C1Z3U0_EUMVA|nr:hypothetical protein EVAR_103453_1 [Eumeta japonica]